MRDPKMITTIGYGGKKPDDFFKELNSLNADLVIDVRENPHKAFLTVYTRNVLKRILKEKYVWLPSCGNVTRKLPPTLKDEKHCLGRIQFLTTKFNRIVLLCAEKDEARCHRSYIKEKLLEKGEAH